MSPKVMFEDEEARETLMEVSQNAQYRHGRNVGQSGFRRIARATKKLAMVLFILTLGMLVAAALLNTSRGNSAFVAVKESEWMQKLADSPLMSKLKPLLNKDLSPANTARPEDRIVLAIKSGSSVIMDRLPVHLINYEKSKDIIPNLLLYSDSHIRIGNYEVVDILANVSEKIQGHKDFQHYKKLHSIIDQGGKITDFKDGWWIDKYKFLPLWGHAYRKYPDADWYVGVEADVFFMWNELVKFLQTQDPTQQALYGCANLLLPSLELFANGGCGYVMSSALMKATYGKDPWGFESRDSLVERLNNGCCGDAELSIALMNTEGVTVRELHPDSRRRFYNGSPWDLVFDDGNWCESIITVHHVDSYRMQQLYNFKTWVEERLDAKDTVRYSDLFDYFSPELVKGAVRSGWPGDEEARQGESWDVVQRGWRSLEVNDDHPQVDTGAKSWEACQVTCRKDAECYTWYWRAEDVGEPIGCYYLRNAIKLGHRVLEDSDGNKHLSGWMGERIDKFRADRDCSGRLVKGETRRPEPTS